jgi:antitoxin component YwqK of YwqJK toxin-antitoxin module
MTKGYNVRDLEMLQDDVGAWYYKLDGTPYTGYAYALFPQSGTVSYEYNLVNGYQEGIQKQWYPNGQLQSEQNFENNIPNGKCSEWHENGVLRFEGEYDFGKKIWSKSYNDRGELIKQYPSTESQA